MAKGFCAPAEVVNVFERRKDAQRGILSSHGEASKFFVTFLDNHDQHQRFYFSSASDPHRFDDQVTLALGCLFALQGIPCLYYGTEQGLHGSGNAYEAVREALWGMPDSFDLGHPFYQAVQRLANLRGNQPSLRYGRQYFRPISGNGTEFGVSHYQRGVLALSRILNDQESVVLANANTEGVWEGEVIIDFALNPVGSEYHVLFSNKEGQQIATPGPVVQKPEGSVTIHETSGIVSNGPVRVLPAMLQPMEVQILGKKSPDPL
jgi:glycosidase